MNFQEALKGLRDSADLKPAQRRKIDRMLGNSKAAKRRCRRCEERAELEVRKAGKQRSLRSAGDVYGDGDNYGFDWSGLLEFLKGLLPIILAFIDALN